MTASETGSVVSTPDSSVMAAAVAAWLESMASHPDRGVRRVAARAEVTPPSLLAALAADHDRGVRMAATAHPATPLESLAAAAQDRVKSVRLAAAANPSTPTSCLIGLAADRAAVVVLAVAKNPSTPIGTLEALAADPHSSKRAAVAKNPGIPADMLTRLAAHPDVATRIAVAINPSSSPEVLAALCRDFDRGVRAAVTRNLNAPRAVLAVLVRDEDPGVRIEAARHPSTSAAAVEPVFPHPGSVALPAAEASNPGIAPSSLVRLASHHAIQVRLAVAGNPSTPLPALIQLSLDPNRFVRRRVAFNRNCPSALMFQMLAGLPDLEVVPQAALHHACKDEPTGACRIPARILEELLAITEADLASMARQAYGPQPAAKHMEVWVRALLARPDLPPAHVFAAVRAGAPPALCTHVPALRSAGRRRRGLVASHDLAPELKSRLVVSATEGQCRHLATNPDPLVRRAVAANPLAGLALGDLVGDDDPCVRRAARERLEVGLGVSD